MKTRCPSCDAPCWCPDEHAAGIVQTVRCGQCGRRVQFDGRQQEGATEQVQNGHAVVMTATHASAQSVRTLVLFDDTTVELHTGSAIGPLEARMKTTRRVVEAWQQLVQTPQWLSWATARNTLDPVGTEFVITAHGTSVTVGQPSQEHAEPERVRAHQMALALFEGVVGKG